MLSLCETFLTNSSKATALLENYSPVHQCRTEKIGGGVYIHDKVKVVRHLDTPFNSAFKSVGTEQALMGKHFTISEVYRPPNSDNVLFSSSMNSLLEQMRKSRNSFIYGDFKFDLIKCAVHKQTKEFYMNLLENDYVPHILKPMRITHSTS